MLPTLVDSARMARDMVAEGRDWRTDQDLYFRLQVVDFLFELLDEGERRQALRAVADCGLVWTENKYA